jgi:hypothetical protein
LGLGRTSTGTVACFWDGRLVKLLRSLSKLDRPFCAFEGQEYKEEGEKTALHSSGGWWTMWRERSQILGTRAYEHY